MPASIPSLRRKLVRGKAVAVVTLPDATTGTRRDIWLGTWGTDESRQRYQQAVAEWLAAGRRTSQPATQGLLVAELIDQFSAWAEGYYSAGEFGTLRSAWGPLLELFDCLPAGEFTPLRLRAVRDAMVARGWVRLFVNHQVRRVVSIWKWAVGRELLPATVWEALRAVEPLREGKCQAIESEAVEPVPDAVVEATLPFLPPALQSLVRLQRLTGARGGEMLALRCGDISRNGDVWRLRIDKHKTAHRGKRRALYFGPQAQAVLGPLLLRPDGDWLFQSGSARGHYSKDSYARAVARAVERLNEITRECGGDPWPHWHPHQLRHTAATEMRREFGLEAAAAVLGHSSPTITDAVYAERDRAVVERVMKRLG